MIFSFSVVLLWDNWNRVNTPVVNTAELQQNPEKLGVAVKPEIAAVKNGIRSAEQKYADSTTVSVETDLYRIHLSTLGGTITRLELLKHPSAINKDEPVVLFDTDSESLFYVAQSGLLGSDLPDHNATYTTEKTQYTLLDKENSLEVPLTFQLNGRQTTKIFTFKRGSYEVGITYKIDTDTSEPLQYSSYYQFVRNGHRPEGDSKLLPTYTGVALYTEQDKFSKVEFGTLEKGPVALPAAAHDGWIGMLQHYFVAAWFSGSNDQREYFAKHLGEDRYAAGVIFGPETAPSGTLIDTKAKLYVGPATSELDTVSPGLGLTVDYGWLTVIATPLFWLMSKINQIVGNWGIAIIILTVLIKLVFFPLSAASYRSMAKMRLVAPKLERIKSQYGDDREQLNKAMIELYRSEKINPLGGCLPVLIQIPVFIALYWSILSSVELRYAPFMGWITDLSVADPYFVLPIIMGISMIVQMRLNPAPLDPLQAKVMQIMPIAFSVIFFFFPAGLVLYSIVNNLLSISQQWYITHRAEGDAASAGK